MILIYSLCELFYKIKLVGQVVEWFIQFPFEVKTYPVSSRKNEIPREKAFRTRIERRLFNPPKRKARAKAC